MTYNGAAPRRRGERFETRAADQLRTNGYTVWQSRGSRTPADLIALRPGTTLLIQCKATTTNHTITSKEWNDLHTLAHLTGATPLLADHDPNRPTHIRWRHITGPHRPHTHDWPSQPWTPTHDLTG